MLQPGNGVCLGCPLVLINGNYNDDITRIHSNTHSICIGGSYFDLTYQQGLDIDINHFLLNILVSLFELI